MGFNYPNYSLIQTLLSFSENKGVWITEGLLYTHTRFTEPFWSFTFHSIKFHTLQQMQQTTGSDHSLSEAKQNY